jgi:hypothetical protein
VTGCAARTGFEEYAATRSLDMSKSPSEVLEYFKGVPGVSKAYVAERLLAMVSALTWLVAFILLAIDEVLALVWLGSGAVPGNSGLAVFSVVTIALALAALIMAPAAEKVEGSRSAGEELAEGPAEGEAEQA